MAALSDVSRCSSCQERRDLSIPLTDEDKLKVKIGEFAQSVLSAKVQDLSREELIKIQLAAPTSPNARFNLMLELYKMKIEACKKAGYSGQDLYSLIEKVSVEKNEGIKIFNEAPAPLKELMFIFDGASHFAKNCILSAKFPSPYLQLAQVEEKMDFPFTGLELLVEEIHLDVKLFLLHPYSATDFYDKTLFPNFVKVIEALERENEASKVQAVFNMYISCLQPRTFEPLNRDGKKDPLIQALPYIVKYGSLDNIEPYFNKKVENEKPYDKTYAWIDLHCQCAELLANTDKEKAKGYLAKAEKLVQEKLPAPFFSFTDTALSQVREKALSRIAKVSL
jgi:hypothetical protein